MKIGELNRSVKEEILPGGKGINVSIVLNNLGAPSCALGFIAGFTGDEIEGLVKARGVETDFIRLDDDRTSRINVKIRGDRESEINAGGPEITSEEWNHLREKVAKIREGVLVLSGSIPRGVPKDAYVQLLQLTRDKDILTVADVSGELLESVLPEHPFLIKPNHHELGEMFYCTIKTHEDAILMARRLQGMGARNVMVSMAGDGAILVTEKGDAFISRAHEGTVYNSVGAGDSMVAGFLYGYLYARNGEMSFRRAFEYGLCAGSASAFSADLAMASEVERLMEKQVKMTQRGIK